MTVESKFSRRTIIQTAALLPAAAITGCATLQQDDKAMLSATDPVARALLYYPNSSDVPADSPLAATHQSSQTCSTCIHARDISENSNVRRCPMFPGRQVNAEGWCSLWAQA